MWRVMMVAMALASLGLALRAAPALSPEETARMLAADIVILGELHDNAAHHEGQAALMRQIRPKAVVFEMLSPSMAKHVNASDRGNLPALGTAIGWEQAGWPPITLYAPVFQALGAARVWGAMAPRETVRAAFAEGAAAVFGEGAERFGLAQALPDQQLAQRRQLQFDAHCAAMPLEMMDGMVEAQRLRDAQFSDVALQALEAHGAPVVVITGNGHARRDWGMPYVIGQAASEVDVFSVGFVETPNPGDDPRFDVTVVTEPAPRGDPCAVFSKD